MDAIQKTEEMPPLPASQFSRNGGNFATLYTEQHMHTYARDYAAQTLASKEAELASREAEIARLRAALHIISSQSIADDWTAAEALGFIKSHARAALTKQPPKD